LGFVVALFNLGEPLTALRGRWSALVVDRMPLLFGVSQHDGRFPTSKLGIAALGWSAGDEHQAVEDVGGDFLHVPVIP
jgi:hypothetical protein